ncbi:MAG TPA: TonB-dependent siderophore receptor [Steroidobacteraceae bacterium]
MTLARVAAADTAAPPSDGDQVTVAQAAPPPQEPASSQPPGSLERVVVTGTREPAKGDYRVDAVASEGPLGSTPILDTPYTIGILPLNLIENSQATNFKDVSKYLPLVQYQEQQGPDILRPQTRGIQGGNFQNSREDGMTMYVTVANAMEQFEQIEVVNGLSASLYGPANPSGMFNFVNKRPTSETLRRVSVTYDSDSIGTAHVDFGGPVDRNGVIGFRFNGLFGEGDGFVDHSRQRRALGSLAFDVHFTQDTVLELNYSDYDLVDKGYPGWFTYNEKVVLPAAPDPTRVGLGQSYAGVDLETHTGSARLKHDFNSDWHLVVGALRQDATRDINTPVNNLLSSAGNYTSSLANGFAPRFQITSDAAYLDGTFALWGLKQDLTIGTAGYESYSWSVKTTATTASVLLGSASIYDPIIFPLPPAGLPNTHLAFDSSNIIQQGVNINDTVHLTEAWLVRLGTSQDWFRTANYSAKGATLPGYTNNGLSPTASLLYKPAQNITTYLTYASSLQAGDTAPGTAANAGVGLAPYRSSEYEVGFKVSLAKIGFTGAVFRVERPFANTDPIDHIFKISGDQVSKGVELSAVGEVVDNLEIYGGVTVLDDNLEKTGVAATNDKTFVGAPKVKGNVLFEYHVPAAPGLVASLDWQFSGDRAGNDTNSFVAAGYSLFDLAARYTQQLAAKTVTWRLSVDNVANRFYWSTVAPSNLTGTNAGNLVAHLGSPRMVLASVSIDL